MSARQQYMRDYYRLRRQVAGLAPRQPAGPLREHIASCRAAGMVLGQIADAAGLHYNTVKSISLGQATTTAATARAILSVQPGPTTTGIVRRIRALAALGWTSPQIADASGCKLATVKHYRAGAVTYLDTETAAAIVRAFTALAMRTPPQSGANKRTRTMSARRGWAPPLAWDDIDDPAERPHGYGPMGGTPPLDLDEWVRIVRLGESPERAAQRCGVGLHAVERNAYRNGRTDVLDLMRRAA